MLPVFLLQMVRDLVNVFQAGLDQQVGMGDNSCLETGSVGLQEVQVQCGDHLAVLVQHLILQVVGREDSARTASKRNNYRVHVEQIASPLDCIVNPVISVFLIDLVILLRYLVS